jgi:DHA1 family multidrug resistance protein B-like MFS transporter
MIVGVLMLGLELQLTNYIGVRLAAEFGERPLLPDGLWGFHVSGIEMLGLLRTENTVLVVVLAGLLLRLTRRLPERATLMVATVIYTAGYAALAVSNVPLLLITATLVMTVGELVYVPIHQSMLAELVRDEQRSRYMAVNALRQRGALLLGSLGVSAGALLSSWAMALLYVGIGAVCFVMYARLLAELRVRESSFTERKLA